MLEEKTPLRPAGPAAFDLRRTMRGMAIALAFTVVVGACGGDATPSPTTAQAVEAPEPPSLTEAPAPQQRPAEGVEIPRGDASIDFEWVQLTDTRIGDQVFALGDGFIGYEFPLATMTVVSEDGLTWVTADIDIGSPEVGADPPNTSTPGGPGYAGFGMAYDDHVLVSRDGLGWELYDELSLEFPELGVFDQAGIETLVVGHESLVLLGRLDRDLPDEHSFFAWVSPDGVSWELVGDAFGAGWVNQVLPVGGGFVAYGFIEGENGGGRIWTSSDGTAWEEHLDAFDDESPGLIGPQTMAVWRDGLVSVDRVGSQIRLWTSMDGMAWEKLPAGLEVDNSEGELRLAAMYAGPLGIVVLAEISEPPEPPPPVTIEKGGIVLRVDNAAGVLTVTDDSGGLLIETPLSAFLEGNEVEGVAVDETDGSITITHPVTGEQISITGEEFEAAADQAFEDAGFDPEAFGQGDATRLLWFSPDGSNWTVIDIEETFGQDDFPHPEGGVIVGASALILRWEVFPGFMDVEGELGDEAPPFLEGEEGEPEHIVWVGRLVAP